MFSFPEDEEENDTSSRRSRRRGGDDDEEDAPTTTSSRSSVTVSTGSSSSRKSVVMGATMKGMNDARRSKLFLIVSSEQCITLPKRRTYDSFQNNRIIRDFEGFCLKV